MEVADSKTVFRPFGFNQLGLDLAKFGIPIQHIIQSRGRKGRRFLCNMGNGQPRWQMQVTLIRLNAPKNEFEQTRLTGSISTGNADPFTPV